ncbi:hypothetical protein BV898_02942 [Hypsibius exemplaris]|uniref:Uncharacterized protein n=1 Tax=Hypsibius exemplaris TaxID=2072580 RepID=A0A1W0X6N9_HYPEX|nr:hypothetical protein BV898_02942 [Hypsibius exemplaris]
MSIANGIYSLNWLVPLFAQVVALCVIARRYLTRVGVAGHVGPCPSIPVIPPPRRKQTTSILGLTFVLTLVFQLPLSLMANMPKSTCTLGSDRSPC